MSQTEPTHTEKKPKKVPAHAQDEASEEIAEAAQDAGAALLEKVEQVRGMVENVRGQAEEAFRERPYLVPVAAGAVGLGVGFLLGSKLTRFIVYTAVGTVVSEALGGQIKKMAGELLGNLQEKLAEGTQGALGTADEAPRPPATRAGLKAPAEASVTAAPCRRGPLTGTAATERGLHSGTDTARRGVAQ